MEVFLKKKIQMDSNDVKIIKKGKIKMQHYKYIHFFWQPDSNNKFNPRVVEMVNDLENGFSSEEHLFITPFKSVYDAISSYPNVILYETKDPYSAKMVNHFAPYGDWLFLHCISDWRKAIWIKKKYQKKIIWRTWGHDAPLYDVNKGCFIKRVVKRILNYLKIQEVRRFYAVGVACIYIDELDIKQTYGNVKMVYISYIDKTSSNLAVEKNIIKNETLNIMVGHSGNEFDNHIKILNDLKKFQNENICIYLVLAYGSKLNIKKIKEYVQTNWKEKVKIISDFMPRDEYQRFCSKMDIAIFDGLPSYAIGNVALLFKMLKKLFFNRNGLWHRTFLEKGAPHLCTDELKNMSFSQFKAPLNYQKKYYEGLEEKNYYEHLDDWKNLLKSLDEVSKNK